MSSSRGAAGTKNVLMIFPGLSMIGPKRVMSSWYLCPSCSQVCVHTVASKELWDHWLYMFRLFHLLPVKAPP